LTPIRPAGPNPTPQAQPVQADTAKLAAQKAFFAALRQAGAPSAPVAAAAPAAPAQAAPTAAARTSAPAEAPQKILRPGSLFDIRV
jgi:hypothetical protein